MGADGGLVGHLHLAHLLAGGLLDPARLAAFAEAHEGDRDTGTPGPAGTADAVGVGLGVLGQVVVEDVGDARHVEAAGGHVGGDQHVDLAALEALDGALAQALVQVAGEAGHVDAAGGELLHQGGAGGPGAHEDDGGIYRLHLEDARQGLQLSTAIDAHQALLDVLAGGGARLDGHLHRVHQVAVDDALDLGRQGRREEDPLGFLGGIGDDALDVIDEAHAQLLVGLVEHQGGEPVELEAAALQVIDDPARGADHELVAALHSHQYAARPLAATSESLDSGLAYLDRSSDEQRQHAC